MEVYDELEKALKKIERQEEKIMRLNIKNLELINIINELEKWIEKERDKWGKYIPDCFVYYQSILDKLQELKGVDKE